MVSQKLGSKNLFAFDRIRRGLVHVAVDTKTIVFEALFVDNDIGGEDGGLDVFEEAVEQRTSADNRSATNAARDSPNMRQHNHSGLGTGDGLDRFEPVHVTDPIDHGIDLA